MIKPVYIVYFTRTTDYFISYGELTKSVQCKVEIVLFEWSIAQVVRHRLFV